MGSSKRPSWRQFAVYGSCVLLVALADPRVATFVAGCVVVGVGWLLRIWAFGHLEKNVVMVTTGPYAHTRNPAYLGSFVILLGTALAAGNSESTQGLLVWGFTAVLVAVFFVFYLPRKFEREYERLRGIFGEQLDRHAENVPDFLPRLTPWRSGDTRRFSPKRVTENHEWAWGLVLAVLMAVVWYAPRWSPLHGVLGS